MVLIQGRLGAAPPGEVSVLVSGTPSPLPWGTAEDQEEQKGSQQELAEVSDKERRAEKGASLRVHVVGEVNAPGLVSLPSGAIVDDAIRAAGGATESAGLSGVNLAAPLSDGQQIIVPHAEQAAQGAQRPQNPGGSAPQDAGKVNLNQADQAELEQLPRVGPVLAQRIIDWREQNGPFTRVADLDAVPGIGPAMLSSLEPLVTV